MVRPEIIGGLIGVAIVAPLVVYAVRDSMRHSRELDAKMKADAAWWDNWAASRAAARQARKAGDDCQGPR